MAGFGLWIVKRLRDLRSGRPETDVLLFDSEEAARDHVASKHPDFVPWQTDEGESVTQWCLGDPGRPEKYLELEGPRSPLGRGKADVDAAPSIWMACSDLNRYFVAVFISPSGDRPAALERAWAIWTGDRGPDIVRFIDAVGGEFKAMFHTGPDSVGFHVFELGDGYVGGDGEGRLDAGPMR